MNSGLTNQSYFSIEKFRQIDVPIIDIRSPKEYKQGHWPGSINLPLFNNEERSEIGTTYKKRGRDKAILLGLKITGPKLLKIQKMMKGIALSSSSTFSFDTSFIDLRIYCWRGGMRSASIAWLGNLFGLNTAILKGGYKSYRNWALGQFEHKWPLHLLGGKTGTGKTDLLEELERKGIAVIDLEGLANHRGSSFGGLGLKKQPSTEHYENLLAEKLEILKINKTKSIWIEAESSHLGCCRIPNSLFKQMKISPLLEIERTDEERVNKLVDVYSNCGKENLLEATHRIQKRLGPQRTKTAIDAISRNQLSKACIEILEYYDKCYDYELSKISSRKIVDISGLKTYEAAKKLIEDGIIN